MSEVKIGDYVMTADGEYSQVYGFGHFDPDLEVEFLQLYLKAQNRSEEQQPLEISSHHLLFVQKAMHQSQVIPASDVVIGDILNDGKRVESIRSVMRRGVYSPLTQSGDIIVSGVRASNYVSVVQDNKWLLWDQHTLGHAYTYPRRLFCKFYIDSCQKETYDNNGYSFSSHIVIRFVSVMNEYGLIGSVIVSALSIPMVGFVYLLENITALWRYCCFAIVITMYMTIRLDHRCVGRYRAEFKVHHLLSLVSVNCKKTVAYSDMKK
jgi:Hint module